MAQRGRKPIDHTQQRFFKLLVLSPAIKQKPGAAMWLCKCDCGRETIVRGSNLRSGNSKSCGMCGRYYAKQQQSERALTYGVQRQRVYDRIVALRKRVDEIRVQGNVTLAKSTLEKAYGDFLWADFDRANINCDLVEGYIENILEQHERVPEHAMVVK